MNLVPSQITINNFEIDEEKRKRDTDLRKKYEKPYAILSNLPYILIGIFGGLFFIGFLAIIVFSQEYAKRILSILWTPFFCIMFGSIIFAIIYSKTESLLLNTYSLKEYDILEDEKKYWNTVKNVLKKETTFISVYPTKENNRNVLCIIFLDENGILNNKKFELSNSQIKFDNIPYEVIDLSVPKFTKNDHNQNDADLSNDYITVTLPLHCFPVYTDQICKENLKDGFE